MLGIKYFPQNLDVENKRIIVRVDLNVPLKNKQEKDLGLKFSKNGIISFIEKFLEHETKFNTNDPITARAWKEKEVYSPGIKLYLK